MNSEDILRKVQDGRMSVEEALKHFGKQPFEEMNYAKPDIHREVRTGFAEVIFCQGKPDEYIVSIFKKLLEAEGEVFGTRATQHQYELVKEEIPGIEYDPVSRILKSERKGKERIGNIAVCTAGTADIPVAEEAACTA